MFVKKSFLLILLCAFFMHGAYADSCVAGQYDNNGTCEQCSGNTYSGDDASECTSCGENTYASTNHTECVACGAANEYIDENSVCQTCGAGNYMNDGVCTECPAGSYCTGDGTAVQCSAGKYSGAGASECTECPLGYTTLDNNNQVVGGAQSISDCKIMPVNLNGVVFPGALTAGKINTKVLKKAD